VIQFVGREHDPAERNAPTDVPVPAPETLPELDRDSRSRESPNFFDALRQHDAIACLRE
jgi:hypothetical protein